MTVYMLDTDTCIYLMKALSPGLIEKVKKFQYGELKISSITQGELERGVQKSSQKEKSRTALLKLLVPFDIVPFESRSAVIFGTITADLERKGMKIGPYDSLIAANAMAHNCTLVTNNVREFERVHGLTVENWLQG